MDLRLEYGESLYRAHRDRPGELVLSRGEQDSKRVQVLRVGSHDFLVQTKHGFHPAQAVREGEVVWVRYGGRTYRFDIVHGRAPRRGPTGSGLASPMPGQVQKLLVSPGDPVVAQQPLLVVEAMKMQLEIKAPQPGIVKRFLAGEGDQVEAGALLVEMAPPP